jgi:hypothetical protein
MKRYILALLILLLTASCSPAAQAATPSSWSSGTVYNTKATGKLVVTTPILNLGPRKVVRITVTLVQQKTSRCHLTTSTYNYGGSSTIPWDQWSITTSSTSKIKQPNYISYLYKSQAQVVFSVTLPDANYSGPYYYANTCSLYVTADGA